MGDAIPRRGTVTVTKVRVSLPGNNCGLGYSFNSLTIQCDVDLRYFWCSSMGVNYSGACSCTQSNPDHCAPTKNCLGYGLGGYPDSPFCVDGPSCQPSCATGSCSFIGAADDDILRQSCISVFKNALTIDGQTSNGRCPCQNGICNGIAPNTLPCKCSTGWTGELCDRNRLCEGVDCLNGGICFKGKCPSNKRKGKLSRKLFVCSRMDGGQVPVPRRQLLSQSLCRRRLSQPLPELLLQMPPRLYRPPVF